MKRSKIFALCLILAMTALILCACSSGSAPVEPESAATPAAAVGDGGDIRVTTVDELLAALGSDRTITLAEGTYELSAASDYGKGPGAWYEWVKVVDGYELHIKGVQNLTLKGDGDVTIATAPRYSFVLSFDDFFALTLSGLTLGHTEERGSCTGGVLMLGFGAGAKVERCKLYGCGTIGLQAYDADDLELTVCEIYDCTSGAVTLYSCDNAVISNSRVHNCGGALGQSVFSVSNSCGFAAVNCQIYDSKANYMLESSYSQELYLLGCHMSKGNIFTYGVFRLTGSAPVVEGCAFTGSDFSLWYDTLYPEADGRCVASDGTELTEEQLADMSHVPADPFAGFKPKPELATVEKTVNAEGLAEAYVKTVDEFLAAIGPDTVIYLDAELFDLSTASGYGVTAGDYYSWAANPDGPQLCIMNVNNLSVTSENNATITAIPRSADVLSFTGCEGVTLSGITLGHTEGPGACSGGVLSFEGCGGVTIEGCRLFGCGILGVRAFDCREMAISETEIYDCSMGAVSAANVSGLTFIGCDIHDCVSPHLSLLGCTKLSYNGEDISGGIYRLVDGKPEEWTEEELQ